eukprot:c10445_g1_i1 orf=67-261(+)
MLQNLTLQFSAHLSAQLKPFNMSTQMLKNNHANDVRLTANFAHTLTFQPSQNADVMLQWTLLSI